MPPKDKTEPDTADAVSAVTEVIDPKTEHVFEFNGHVYQFKRKRLNATQFRLPMQKGFNELAVEWLLGPTDFAQFLNRNLDDEGMTPTDVFYDFINQLGEGLGAGNS